VVKIHGFLDEKWAGDLYRSGSTNGYVFNLFGGEINWMRKRQVVVALSTIEAMLKLLRQLRGGVNQLLLCLNNFKSIKPFLIFH
jgi:hypothetical protein